MEDIFYTYILPTLIIFGKSLLLLVGLLLATAYILYADRKIFAGHNAVKVNQRAFVQHGLSQRAIVMMVRIGSPVTVAQEVLVIE